ncbi:MAG: hypothetical protein ABIP65_05455 [Vicinamibacterales bacterium]
MKRHFAAAVVCTTICALDFDRLGARAETWFEIKSQNLTVWANANDGNTRTLIWQIEQLRNVAKTLWPWLKVDLPKPLVILAVKDEQSMKALAPHYWEVKGGLRPASVWISGPDQHYIAIRSDVRAKDSVMVNPHVSAYFSYANLALGSSFGRPLPLWVSRGLAGVLSNTLVRQNDVLVGTAIPWHLETLRERRLPLAKMISATRGSPELARDEAARYFDAQCWAFVHYLMFGEEGRNAPRLNAYVGLLEKGQAPGDAFAAALGSIDEYDRAFSAYVNRSIFAAVRINVDAGVDRERFPTRAMSPVESALARGSFHAALGREPEARALIAEVLKVDPNASGPSVLEGLLFERAGKNQEAANAYIKAASLGTTNAYALYRSAMLTWRDSDAAGLAVVEKNLAKAVEINPLFAAAHASLAEIRAELKRPSPTIVLHMHKAIALEPSEPWHRIIAARVLGRLNAFDEARKAAEGARNLAADDPSAQREIERILRMLKDR